VFRSDVFGFLFFGSFDMFELSFVGPGLRSGGVDVRLRWMVILLLSDIA
jgi:hypothetical protein